MPADKAGAAAAHRSQIHGPGSRLMPRWTRLRVDDCIAYRYSRRVIRSFAHKGLEAFFLKGSKAGIQPAHVARLGAMLRRLNEAPDPQAMNLPGWGLHLLKGNLKGHWSVRVSGNWRLTFRFVGQDVELVDYQDYH